MCTFRAWGEGTAPFLDPTLSEGGTPLPTLCPHRRLWHLKSTPPGKIWQIQHCAPKTNCCHAHVSYPYSQSGCCVGDGDHRWMDRQTDRQTDGRTADCRETGWVSRYMRDVRVAKYCLVNQITRTHFVVDSTLTVTGWPNQHTIASLSDSPTFRPRFEYSHLVI